MTSISELKYIEKEQVIICELCNKKDYSHSIEFVKNSPGVFKLENIEEPKEETENMPDSFRNLKKSVKKTPEYTDSQTRNSSTKTGKHNIKKRSGNQKQ